MPYANTGNYGRVPGRGGGTEGAGGGFQGGGGGFQEGGGGFQGGGGNEGFQGQRGGRGFNDGGGGGFQSGGQRGGGGGGGFDDGGGFQRGAPRGRGGGGGGGRGAFGGGGFDDGESAEPRGGRGGMGSARGREVAVRGGDHGMARGGGGRGGGAAAGPVDYGQMKPEFPHERIDVVGQYGPDAGKHVDAYFEYKKIVQDDDGGKTFTPEEYERYKKRVIPMRIKNRLFVSWVNPNGMDCKCVGPETPCRCTHRYHQHKTDLEKIPDERPILVPCQVSGCKCKSYNFVPKNGSQSIRCKCKHFTEEHDIIDPYPCRSCKDCKEFKSSFTDNCQHATYTHYTLVETRQEREKRGHPVGPVDVPYKAMGALTGFNALAEGYERMDDSGAGRARQSLLDAPITSNDHPFLRMHAQTIHQHEMAQGKPMPQMENYEAVSGVKRPGETDMDFFERRYQERLRAERGGGGGGGPNRRMVQSRGGGRGGNVNQSAIRAGNASQWVNQGGNYNYRGIQRSSGHRSTVGVAANNGESREDTKSKFNYLGTKRDVSYRYPSMINEDEPD